MALIFHGICSVVNVLDLFQLTENYQNTFCHSFQIKIYVYFFQVKWSETSLFSPKFESKQTLKNDTKFVFVKCASGPELVHFTPVFFLLFFKCASGVGSCTLKIKTKTAAQSATAEIWREKREKFKIVRKFCKVTRSVDLRLTSKWIKNQLIHRT